MRGSLEPPDGLTSDQRDLWRAAFRQGYDCDVSGGVLEQNPYPLNSPLFSAWDSGWLNGPHVPSPLSSTQLILRNHQANALWAKKFSSPQPEGLKSKS